MAKRIIWCLIAATLVMTLHGREGKAEENICISPTTTSGVTIPPDWHGDLAIYAEKWTISRGEGIALWCVCGEGPLCPEYQWSVSGNGFHFDSSAGPTTGETQKQFEIIELWADNTACGTATVTVTDYCGVSSIVNIRCTAGVWTPSNHTLNPICGVGTGQTKNTVSCSGAIVDNKYKYYVRRSHDPGNPNICCDNECTNMISNGDICGFTIDSCQTRCNPSTNYLEVNPGWHWYFGTKWNLWRQEWTCP